MIHSILIVDDDVQILRAFRKVFQNSRFVIYYNDNGKDALSFLSTNAVDLIIVDVRMPGMDGLELLRTVKDKYPRMMRILLSGFTDMKTVFKALEENLAKTYWVKPWTSEDFIANIQKFSDLEDLFSKKELLEFFNNVGDLPTMPQMYLDIARLVREEADVERISKLIEKDPALASQVLRIANSAFFGAQTGSIHQSIMFIGLANVKNIILSHSVFEKSTLQRGVFQNLWKHANRTNAIANLLYTEFLGRKIPQIYASAGLLHNIGLVVLWMRYGNRYLEHIDGIGGEGDIGERETRFFGVNHSEIGAYLLNWWDLPLPIVEAALYHHNPSDENIINKELVAVIHISHYYAWESLGEDFFKEPLNETMFAYLDIPKTAFEARMQQMTFE